MRKVATSLSKVEVPNVEALDSIEVPTSKTLLYTKT
jgi:hypothetical protein